jgi:two-component system OmpR family sensor kinase
MKAGWSIARRLVVILGTGVTLLWLGAVAVSTAVIMHEINEVFDSALQETAQRLLPLALDNLGEADRDRAIGRHSDLSEEYLLYQIRDRAGRVLLRSHDAPLDPFPVALEPGFVSIDGSRFYSETTPDGAYAIQVLEQPGHRTESILNAMLGLVFPLLLLLPLAGVVIFATVGRTLRPIRHLREAIGARGGQNLAPLPEAGIPRELAPIVHDINRLLARLGNAIAAERDFAANSAHELRTPVAAAIAQSQRLGAELAGSPHQARVEQLLMALRRLGHLVERLLQLARAESGIAASRETVDLLPVVELVIGEFERQHGAARRIVLRQPAGPYRGAIDIDAFGIVLRNLLENALAHGSKDAAIELFIDHAGCLHVVNEGPVVPQEELRRLTERFARGRGEGSGFGLGLAIVAMILGQAGGRLDLHSPAGGSDSGFEAIISLP